jgi:hypothetical protein
LKEVVKGSTSPSSTILEEIPVVDETQDAVRLVRISQLQGILPLTEGIDDNSFVEVYPNYDTYRRVANGGASTSISKIADQGNTTIFGFDSLKPDWGHSCFDSSSC